MSTTSPAICDDDALGRADSSAVLEHFSLGTPLEPGLLERVRNRAARITAEIEREHGLLDDDTFQTLLDEEA